jgi:hypothetical protein
MHSEYSELPLVVSEEEEESWRNQHATQQQHAIQLESLLITTRDTVVADVRPLP